MSAIDLVPALALLAVLTRELLWLTAAAIFISSLDDIAVDLLWLSRIAFRETPPLPDRPATPGRFAILIPAWDEAAVIGPMLTRLLATLEHPAFTLFVGSYPNDPATRAAVTAIADPRVIPVQTDRPGPTTKADCLNHLWRAARAHEAATGLSFKAIVLHDAEDVVHPASLDIYDRHMPALAMVQLPVLPLPDRASRWIAGHYLDEFAQTHAKDMIVRALLDAPVPSAGVGTAIDRDVLASLAGPADAPFDATSLTEDYELGHKIHAMGLKGRMVRVRLNGELVCTREYFPATLDAAVRQKSRWLVGIALSGWDRLGWHGSRPTRWMLLRDRKGLFTAAVAMLAYGAMLLTVTQLALRASVAQSIGQPLPPLIGESGALLPAFLLFNALLLLWRLLLRAGFTGRHHGLAEALRSVPRAIVANAINFLAALRAVDRYRSTVERGVATPWDKTAHRFPGPHLNVPETVPNA
jgi:adsorption protein B